ncbi:MAG: hypothetical protein HRU34_02090 [Richelia sp.]|nr:hypothetical protein [Richelia sp.]
MSEQLSVIIFSGFSGFVNWSTHSKSFHLYFQYSLNLQQMPSQKSVDNAIMASILAQSSKRFITVVSAVLGFSQIKQVT